MDDEVERKHPHDRLKMHVRHVGMYFWNIIIGLLAVSGARVVLE